MYVIFFSSYKINDSMNIIIVEIRIMFFTPMFGIKMNPAVKVPTILPIVDKADIFPEIFPMLFSFSYSISFNLTAKGEIVAKKRLVGPNVILEHIIAIILGFIFVVNPDSGLIISISIKGIRLVKRAAFNKNSDMMLLEGFLSAIFPPI